VNLVFLLVMVIIEENIDFSLTEYFVFVLDNKRSRLSPPTLLAVFNCQPAAGRLPKNDMSCSIVPLSTYTFKYKLVWGFHLIRVWQLLML